MDWAFQESKLAVLLFSLSLHRAKSEGGSSWAWVRGFFSALCRLSPYTENFLLSFQMAQRLRYYLCLRDLLVSAEDCESSDAISALDIPAKSFLFLSSLKKKKKSNSHQQESLLGKILKMKITMKTAQIRTAGQQGREDSKLMAAIVKCHPSAFCIEAWSNWSDQIHQHMPWEIIQWFSL